MDILVKINMGEIPCILEEERVEPIRARCFKGLHGKKCILDLFHRRGVAARESLVEMGQRVDVVSTHDRLGSKQVTKKSPECVL